MGKAKEDYSYHRAHQHHRTVARNLSVGELYVYARGGAWHSNLTKIPLIYIVSCFNLEGLGALFRGLSPPKLPVATGLQHDRLCAEKTGAFLRICKNGGNVEVRNMLWESRGKIIYQSKHRLSHGYCNQSCRRLRCSGASSAWPQNLRSLSHLLIRSWRRGFYSCIKTALRYCWWSYNWLVWLPSKLKI